MVELLWTTKGNVRGGHNRSMSLCILTTKELCVHGNWLIERRGEEEEEEEERVAQGLLIRCRKGSCKDASSGGGVRAGDWSRESL